MEVPCSLIQWGKSALVLDRYVCPECGEEAELVPSFFGGWPGFAHRIFNKGEKRVAIRDIQTAVDAFLGLTEEEKAIFSKEVAAGKKRGRKPGFASSRKGKKLGPRKAKSEAEALNKTFPKNKPGRPKKVVQEEPAEAAVAS